MMLGRASKYALAAYSAVSIHDPSNLLGELQQNLYHNLREQS